MEPLQKIAHSHTRPTLVSAPSGLPTREIRDAHKTRDFSSLHTHKSNERRRTTTVPGYDVCSKRSDDENSPHRVIIPRRIQSTLLLSRSREASRPHIELRAVLFWWTRRKRQFRTSRSMCSLRFLSAGPRFRTRMTPTTFTPFATCPAAHHADSTPPRWLVQLRPTVRNRRI